MKMPKYQAIDQLADWGPEINPRRMIAFAAGRFRSPTA